MKLFLFQSIYSLPWLGFNSILLRSWIEVRWWCNDEHWFCVHLRILCVILPGVVSACFHVSAGLWLYSLDGRVLDATGLGDVWALL